MILIMYVAIAFSIFCVVALLLTPMLVKPSMAGKRLLETVRTNRADERTIGSRQRTEEWLLRAARRFRTTLGFSIEEKLTQRLFSAGFKRNSVDSYFAGRFLSPLLGVSLGSMVPQNTLMGMLVGGG